MFHQNFFVCLTLTWEDGSMFNVEYIIVVCRLFISLQTTQYFYLWPLISINNFKWLQQLLYLWRLSFPFIFFPFFHLFIYSFFLVILLCCYCCCRFHFFSDWFQHHRLHHHLLVLLFAFLCSLSNSDSYYYYYYHSFLLFYHLHLFSFSQQL